MIRFFILVIRKRLTYTIDQGRCIFQEMSDLYLYCLSCTLFRIELMIDLFYWKSNIILLWVDKSLCLPKLKSITVLFYGFFLTSNEFFVQP